MWAQELEHSIWRPGSPLSRPGYTVGDSCHLSEHPLDPLQNAVIISTPPGWHSNK